MWKIETCRTRVVPVSLENNEGNGERLSPQIRVTNRGTFSHRHSPGIIALHDAQETTASLPRISAFVSFSPLPLVCITCAPSVHIVSRAAPLTFAALSPCLRRGFFLIARARRRLMEILNVPRHFHSTTLTPRNELSLRRIILERFTPTGEKGRITGRRILW